MTLLSLMISPRGQSLDRWLVRWMGYSLLNRLFARHEGFSPRPALLLQTVGRKSGLLRSAALPYFLIEGRYVVVASMGGAPVDPAWVQNLRQQPEAMIYRSCRRYAVRAHFLEGQQYQQAWKEVCQLVPTYAHYQTLTRRSIPLVALETE